MARQREASQFTGARKENYNRKKRETQQTHINAKISDSDAKTTGNST